MDSDTEFVEAALDHDGFVSSSDDDYDGPSSSSNQQLVNEQETELDNESRHKQLLRKISKLNLPERLKRKQTRSEIRDLGEFNLLRPKQQKVQLSQLVGSIRGSANDEQVSKIKKVAKKLSHRKLLQEPLEKVHQNRLERSVFYEKAVKQVARWESVVLQNRVSDQLRFPLKQPETRLTSSLESAKQFKPKTNFEMQIQHILDSSENYLNEDTALTEAEEKALKAMSLEEAKARHRELRKTRALLSYREAKLHRQNKIKSKSYHRILKREKLRKSMKEFEELKQKDPQKALEKLKELERLRMQERASLKHLNTGKWAKLNKIRAKHDKEARDKLAEQLNLNKDLIKKLYEESEDEEEEFEDELHDDYDANFGKSVQTDSLSSNPLTNFEITEHGLDEQAPGQYANEDTSEKSAFFRANYADLIQKIDLDELRKEQRRSQAKNKRKQQDKVEEKTSTKQKVTQIDIDNEGESEQEVSDNDDDEGDQDEQAYRHLVSEALAEDDVIEEFQKDKDDVIQDERGKDKDTFLPGWGRWGGAGVKVPKKVRNKFVVKAKDIKRKDRTNTNVIISEKKDQVITKFMPKSLPPGIKDKKTYEKKVSKPVGVAWNPETVFKNLVRPSVLTKLGTKIDPMDETELPKAERIYNKSFARKVKDIIRVE